MVSKIIYLLSFVFIISCKSHDLIEGSNSNDVLFSYSPTQCSEKWQFGATDFETLANIKLFLKENEIVAKVITISKPDGKIYCAACNCPSGRYIDLTADISYLEKLKKLGYVQKIIN